MLCPGTSTLIWCLILSRLGRFGINGNTKEFLNNAILIMLNAVLFSHFRLVFMEENLFFFFWLVVKSKCILALCRDSRRISQLCKWGLFVSACLNCDLMTYFWNVFSKTDSCQWSSTSHSCLPLWASLPGGTGSELCPAAVQPWHRCHSICPSLSTDRSIIKEWT